MGHSIHKHMKSFQSRELTDMPIMHDEEGEGRGGHEGGPSPAKQQSYNDRLHESLGMRHPGHHSQSLTDRAHESKGMEKALGHRAYSGNESSAQGPPNLGSPAKQYSEGFHQGKGWKHKVYGAKED